MTDNNNPKVIKSNSDESDEASEEEDETTSNGEEQFQILTVIPSASRPQTSSPNQQQQQNPNQQQQQQQNLLDRPELNNVDYRPLPTNSQPTTTVIMTMRGRKKKPFFEIVNDDGKLGSGLYNIRLPIQIEKALKVYSLGTVAADSFGFHDKNHIWPIGFKR